MFGEVGGQTARSRTARAALAILPAFAQTAPAPPDDLKTPPIDYGSPYEVLAPGTGTGRPSDDDFITPLRRSGRRRLGASSTTVTTAPLVRADVEAPSRHARDVRGDVARANANAPGFPRFLGAGKIARRDLFVVDGAGRYCPATRHARPTSRAAGRCDPRRSRASRTRSSSPGGTRPPETRKHRPRELHRLDHGREDVRHVYYCAASRPNSRSNAVIAGWTEGCS